MTGNWASGGRMGSTPKRDKDRSGSKKKKKSKSDSPRSHHKSLGGAPSVGAAGAAAGGAGLNTRLAQQWEAVTSADRLVMVSEHCPCTSRF